MLIAIKEQSSAVSGHKLQHAWR